jgi:hypothetical protein
MTRTSNILSHLTSVKGIAAFALVLTALVLPACGGVGEEEGIYEEGVQEEGVYEEEGLGEEGVYQEEEQGFGEEGIGEEDLGDE